MSFRTILATMALAAAAFVAAPSAHADLITGSIDVTGSLTPVDSSNVATTLGLATGFTFLAGSSQIAFGTQTGDLTVMPNFNPVTMTDFQFSPFSSVIPLYISTFGSDVLSFDLLTLVVDV